MQRRVVLAWLTAWLAGPARAQGDGAEALRAATGAPAALVAVRRRGEDPHIAVAGVLRRGQAAPVGPEAPWHIGSNTKAMTAHLAARLAAAGRIDWQAPLGQVLAGVVPFHSEAADLTLAELFRHRSGLPANIGLLLQARLTGDGRDAMADRRTYSAAVLTSPPAGRGEYRYSNAGYVVAAAMIEAQTGQPWEDLMRAEIIGPYGLAGAGFGAPSSASAPWGHRTRLIGGLAPVPPGPAADNIVALGPAGRMHLPAQAMLTWLALQADRDPAVLPPAGWSRLLDPAEGEDYALGWGLSADGATWLHAGSNTYWLVVFAFRPASGVAVALALNRGGDAPGAEMVRFLDDLLKAG